MPGGLASDPEHAVLAHMFPTPPTNENTHTLSPGLAAPDFGSDYGVGDAYPASVEPTVTVSVSSAANSFLLPYLL